NTTAALTAAPTAESGLNNLWAANEELLRSGTDFDGIWLAGSISTGANNPYGTGTNEEVIAWLETNLPNLWAADALSMKFNNGESYVKYGIISIPSGKTLDLNGKTLTLRATRPTLGEGEIVANDGSITLWYNGTTSSVGGQTLKNADDIAAERTGIVKAYNQTGSAVQYNNYPIPSGVTLTLAGTSTVTEGHTVTFMVANEADFTRTGTDSEKITDKTFKLANDLTLTQNIDVGDANVDYNHHEVTGGEIITTGEVTNKVVAVTETPATEAELETALKAGLPTVTLAADIDCEGAVTVPAGTTLALGNYNLAVVGLTNNGTITKGTGKLTWKVSYPNAWVASYTNDQLLQDNSFLKALNAMNEASSPIDTIKFTTNIWATVSTMPDAISAAIFPNLANDGSRYILNIPEGKTVEMNGKNLYVNANSDTFGAGTLQDTVGGSVVRTYCSSSTALANSIPLATAYPTATFEMMTNASWSASTFDVPAAANVNFKMNSGNACTFRSVSVYAGRMLDISGSNGGTLDAQYLKMGSGATFKLTKDKVTLPEVILFEVSPSTLAADIANAEAQIAYLEAQGVLNFSNIQFKLTLDHNYAQNIDLSAYDYDFEFGGSYINGNYTVTVKSGRTVTKEFGGGYATTVTSRSDFVSAVGNNKWDKIIVNGTFTVYQNVNAAAKVIEIVSGKTLTMSGSYVLTCRDIIGDGTFVGRVGKSQTVSSAAELVTYLREASANTANTYMLTLTNDIDARRATWSGGAAIENSTNTGIVMTIPSNVELDLNGYNLTVRHLNGTGAVDNGTVTYGVWNTMSLDRALDALTTSSYKSLIKTIIVMDSFDYGKALTIPSGVTVRFENNYRVITKGVTNNGAVDKGEYPYAMFALGVASEAEINAGNANLQGCDEMALTAAVTYDGTLTLANKLDLNGKTLTVADIAAGSGEKLLNYRRATTVGTPGKLRLGVTTAEALAGAATTTFTAGSETVQSIWVNSSTGSNLNKVTVTDYTVNELADAEKIAIIADLTLDRDITINRNVKLEADAEGTGYVLNLNGHTLNLGSYEFATSFGFVIDTATADPDNTLEDFGLLKAGKYSIVNTGRNIEPTATDLKQAYQPMYHYYDAEGKVVYGYRFFKISTNLRTAPKITDGKLTFKFVFDFANKTAWDFYLTGRSYMQYYVGLESAPSETAESKTITFVFTADVLRQYAEKQKAQVDGQQNVLTMSFSSFESLRGRYVWTDPYLGMKGVNVAYENRGDLKFKPMLIDGENTTFDGTTIGEMIEAGDLSPAQDALLATAFAYYNMNPMTQYGMNYYGHAGEIRTDADGNIINTEPGIGNMLTNVFFNTRSTRGWRRTTRISPESVAEDNFYYSQCSEFPYNVYYNTILNEDGTPYEYYGGPSALFDSWYRDGVRGLVPVDGNGNVLDRSDYNFSAKLSYYRMPKQLEINADKNNGRANEYGYVVTGFNSGWSSYPTVLPQSKVGGTVEEALDNVSTLAQPGDIFYVPSHVLLCIGDYDNDGYMEFMHCWPVVSTDDTEDFTANGNFASELTYRFKAVGTSYSEVNSATHYLDGDKMVAFAANAGYSTKYAKRGSLYKLTNTYEPGEKHEQSGALEIVELKNNKLTVDTPISGSTSTSTQRFNMAAQDYFFVFRPLMSTKHADELATGYNQSLSCVNATISPAASARRAYGTKMAEGVQLEKYVYSGDRLHTWDTLLAGETYTLEETIVNTTASAITFNEIREGLPKGTTFISASAGGTQLSGGSRNVLWSDVTVAANGSTTVSITFKVNDNVATGTVLDFPSGYVGQMESRHFGIKVGANAVSNADVNALSALATSGNVTAAIKGNDASVATDLAFVKQVYKNVVGKELDIPDTAAAYIESGFENSDGAKGYDFESAYFRTKMYKSVLVDVVTKNTEVQRNTQAGNMAEMLINKHIGGKLVSLCIDDNGNFSPFKVTDDNLQENYTMYELLYENRYQVGDFLMTIQACHSVDRFDRFYTGNGLSVNDPYTMNTDTQYVTVSIYLGNGKVLELSGNGTPEVKNFAESEFNTAVGEAFFGVFRPRQSESYGG
ncbi:MAG: hypothetical protein IJT07_01180, partial [Oscillospiraceae bacterium]|nr:hypothetical protein [Oscillospiraceae bacterium]